MSYVAIRAIARIMPDIKSTYSPDLIRREFIECITQKWIITQIAFIARFIARL